MYLNCSEIWRVGVVVLWKAKEIRIQKVWVRGLDLTLGCDFLSF